MAKKKAAPKKKKPTGYIAKAPIRRLMDYEGADLVAADALDRLIAYLEGEAARVTKEAGKITKAIFYFFLLPNKRLFRTIR
ncbi:MAG: hypothetical protein P8Y97_13270 [Candidatus Lokiarchaeota archaeon]